MWKSGMMGLIAGDALGVPVQFMTREEISENPVETMTGYGTYLMPPGTWSDDSSMALATMTSLLEKGGVDYDDMMERFMLWYFNGEYTPEGLTFDQGLTCTEAIYNYTKNGDYKTCGKTGERANGNGALMRILPVCIYAYQKVRGKEWTEEKAVEVVHQVSALTHNHLRSKMACGIYFFLVKNILDAEVASESLHTILQSGIDEAVSFYQKDIANYVELAHYGRIFHLEDFKTCPAEKIKSTGYVVDSLEAAIWCLINTESLKDALLKAVNLGDDTDTVAAIVGGLAGLFYGYEAIPEEWLKCIINHDDIMDVCEEME